MLYAQRGKKNSWFLQMPLVVQKSSLPTSRGGAVEVRGYVFPGFWGGRFAWVGGSLGPPLPCICEFCFKTSATGAAELPISCTRMPQRQPSGEDQANNARIPLTTGWVLILCGLPVHAMSVLHPTLNYLQPSLTRGSGGCPPPGTGGSPKRHAACLI